MQKVLRKVSLGLKRFQQANPVGKAQKNVAHHYDLGNDFYKLFLDEGMQYSCAYFLDDAESLEQAQRNKLRLVASKLALKPGLRVLDIGSGWGDLALYLAAMEDVDVTGVTLSKEQHALANAKAQRAGLSHRVRFRLPWACTTTASSSTR
jgi:cyclopropane-fatty-acyl-phospholipid synthase